MRRLAREAHENPLAKPYDDVGYVGRQSDYERRRDEHTRHLHDERGDERFDEEKMYDETELDERSTCTAY